MSGSEADYLEYEEIKEEFEQGVARVEEANSNIDDLQAQIEEIRVFISTEESALEDYKSRLAELHEV